MYTKKNEPWDKMLWIISQFLAGYMLYLRIMAYGLFHLPGLLLFEAAKGLQTGCLQRSSLVSFKLFAIN